MLFIKDNLDWVIMSEEKMKEEKLTDKKNSLTLASRNKIRWKSVRMLPSLLFSSVQLIQTIFSVFVLLMVCHFLNFDLL